MPMTVITVPLKIRVRYLPGVRVIPELVVHRLDANARTAQRYDPQDPTFQIVSVRMDRAARSKQNVVDSGGK